jgi:hypothetical protein
LGQLGLIEKEEEKGKEKDFSFFISRNLREI